MSSPEWPNAERRKYPRRTAAIQIELCEGKLSCTVLRGLDGSNPVRLLDMPRKCLDVSLRLLG
jgi:hypothetical protein